MNRNYLIKLKKFLLIATLLGFSKLYAWDSHYLITYGALQNKVSNELTIPAESLDNFLKKEEQGLIQALSQQEAWSKSHIHYYRPVPSYLYWQNQSPKTPLAERFAQAIRVNPLMNFPLFIQYPKGDVARERAKAVSFDEVVLPEIVNSTSLHIPFPPFEAVTPGQLLSPLEILATASDEPDYGMDIHLWEDSPSWFGKIYNWGVQPFGSKTLSYSSQIPFHMGLYYETSLVDIFAPYLKHGYPEYRINQYLNLSHFAFSKGHPYWGYRFLGWALHYAQDLAQPYHSTLSPNISIPRLLYVDALKLLGFTSTEQNLIQLLTNKHNSLENYEYFYLKNRFESKDEKNKTIQALTNNALDSHYPGFYDNYPREVIAKQSHALASSLDQMISEVLPARIVADSQYIFYETEISINLFDSAKHSEGLEALNTMINVLLANAGAHSRKLVEFVVQEMGNSEAQQTPR